MNTTILYYTSNQEDPIFEKKIVDDMLSKKGDIPIISVSQKPMDLGQNICVGNVGISYINEYRQILTGAKLAKTDYLIMAESDFLYPPEYFKFKPRGKNIYLYDNVWVMWLISDKTRFGNKHFRTFHRKKRSEGAQCVKRVYFIDILERYLKQFPTWCNKDYPKPPHSPYYKQSRDFFHGENPCVSIKTGDGVDKFTGFENGPENISKNLPYWGDVNKLRSKFS